MTPFPIPIQKSHVDFRPRAQICPKIHGCLAPGRTRRETAIAHGAAEGKPRLGGRNRRGRMTHETPRHSSIRPAPRPRWTHAAICGVPDYVELGADQEADPDGGARAVDAMRLHIVRGSTGRRAVRRRACEFSGGHMPWSQAPIRSGPSSISSDDSPHGACVVMLVEPDVNAVPPLPDVAFTVTVPAVVVD